MENTIIVKGQTFKTWILPTCIRIMSATEHEIIEIDYEGLSRYYGGKPDKFFGKCIGEWFAFA